MKNPNGYGTVVRLSGNRRRPFAVRKTKGWNDKGHPIYLTIGYYATRTEGMIALAEYNKSPYDVEVKNITLKKLYEQWEKAILIKLGKSLQGSLKSAYKHIQKLEDRKYRDIRSFHMQDTIDNCGRGYSTQGAIKNLWGYLDRYAMELDVISKMYSSIIKAAPVEESNRKPFTDKENEILWQHEDEEWVDAILIMLYTGWRILEFCTIRTDQIDLKDMTMKGGVKTRNGKGRIIPIHSRIQQLVDARYRPESELFLTDASGRQLTVPKFRQIFKTTLLKYGINHLPHETRHTFRTRLDAAGGNKKCIDMLMGHKSRDVGERIYTHKSIEELRQTIELIT